MLEFGYHVLVGNALDSYSIALDFFSGKAVPPDRCSVPSPRNGRRPVGRRRAGRGHTALSHFCYRRRKSRAPTRARKAGGPTEGQPQRLV